MWTPEPSDIITAEAQELDALTSIRTDRNSRLAASDWVILRSLETNDPVPKAWLDYRQALRDMPITLEPNWPNEP